MLDRMIEKLGSKTGDTVVFIAATPKIVADALAHLRLAIAKLLKRVDESKNAFIWVTEFPLVEYDEAEKGIMPCTIPSPLPVKKTWINSNLIPALLRPAPTIRI